MSSKLAYIDKGGLPNPTMATQSARSSMFLIGFCLLSGGQANVFEGGACWLVKRFSIACQEASGENSSPCDHANPLFPWTPGTYQRAVVLHHPPKVSHHCTVNSSKRERSSGDGHEMCHEIQEGRVEKIFFWFTIYNSIGKAQREKAKFNLVSNGILYIYIIYITEKKNLFSENL